MDALANPNIAREEQPGRRLRRYALPLVAAFGVAACVGVFYKDDIVELYEEHFLGEPYKKRKLPLTEFMRMANDSKFQEIYIQDLTANGRTLGSDKKRTATYVTDLPGGSDYMDIFADFFPKVSADDEAPETKKLELQKNTSIWFVNKTYMSAYLDYLLYIFMAAPLVLLVLDKAFKIKILPEGKTNLSL